jgi:outer membrane protein insertion porin family
MTVDGVRIAVLLLPSLVAAPQLSRAEDHATHAQRATLASRASRTAVIDEVRFNGLRRIAPETVKAHMGCRPGDKLAMAHLEKDLRSLARLGWFDILRVEAEDSAQAAGSAAEDERTVRLTFYVDEHPFLAQVEFSGSRVLSEQHIHKLLAERKLSPALGEPENVVTLDHAAKAIQSVLADLGHPKARVPVCLERLPNATVRARFEIDDGPYLPVGRVRFEGHPYFSAKILRQQLHHIAPHSLLSGLGHRDAYTHERFEADRERLLAYYQDHGFPAVQIGEAKVSEYLETSRHWLPWPRGANNPRLAITVPVEAGAFYRLGSIEVSEALSQALTRRRSSQIAPPNAWQGIPYSQEVIDRLRRSWQARIQPKPSQNPGVPFRTVEVVRRFDENTHTTHIQLDLSRTPPYIVRRLEFRGMHGFPDRFFRRRISVREGSPLNEAALESGLARLTRTGYFKPLRKEDISVQRDELAHSVDITIHVQELGQQRISLVGGRSQFGNTLGLVYSMFNLLDREELLSSHIEGGPETLQLAVGLTKDSFLGSRGTLALSLFNTFLRPRITGTVKGPFFEQRSTGITADWTYSLSNADILGLNYNLSHSKTQYSPLLPAALSGLTVSNVGTATSSHAIGLGWTRDTGDQRITLSNSVSGGWLGGSENLWRSHAEYGRMVRDHILNPGNSWAFRATLRGVASYAGDTPFYTRFIAGDEFVRGLRNGELGPQTVVSSFSPSGATKYSPAAAGANLIGAANAEYRVPLPGGTETAAFFDLGSGMLLPNWLGRARPSLIDSTNGLLHSSTGIELRWNLPVVGVPIRSYYALNLLRLKRTILLPDASPFQVHNRLATFGWALGTLF